jgi:DNA-binding CsgD family transcriptional regulator
MLQALGTADLQGALDVLGAIAEGTAADGDFARHGVMNLPRLVPSDVTTLSIRDDAGHQSLTSNRPGRPIHVDHAIAVPIHAECNELVRFVLTRQGRDFSDRDRDCLEAIRPHLGNLYRLTRNVGSPRAAWGVPRAMRIRCELLTAREREVLQWLAGGKTDRDIACILGISPRTVHKHLQRMYEKLGVETRTAAVTRVLVGT